MQAAAMRAFVDDLSTEQLVARPACQAPRPTPSLCRHQPTSLVAAAAPLPLRVASGRRLSKSRDGRTPCRREPSHLWRGQEHWLAVEEGVRAGCRRGAPPARAVALSSLEQVGRPTTSSRCSLARADRRTSPPLRALQLAADPARTLRKLRRWLGLGATAWDELPATRRWLSGVRAAPNARYATELLAALRGSHEARVEHARLGARFGARVAAASGYADWRHASEAVLSAAPRRDLAWQREWLGVQQPRCSDLAPGRCSVPDLSSVETLDDE